MPQYSIPPGGVEGEGADLVVPLDAVDGQLALGGGGGDVGGQVGHQAQSADGQQGPGDSQVPLAQEEDFPRSGGFSAKQLHSDPVLSLQKNLCAKGIIMRQGREKGRAVQNSRRLWELLNRRSAQGFPERKRVENPQGGCHCLHKEQSQDRRSWLKNASAGCPGGGSAAYTQWVWISVPMR